MDDETREAQELTKADLLRMAEGGKRARIARRAPRRVRKKQGLNQRAGSTVSEATDETGAGFAIEWHEGSITIVNSSVKRSEPLRFPRELGLKIHS